MFLNPRMTLLQRQRNHIELFDHIYQLYQLRATWGWFLLHLVSLVTATHPLWLPPKCFLMLSFVLIFHISYCNMPCPKKATDLRHPELYTASRLRNYHKHRPGVKITRKETWGAKLRNSVCGSRGRPGARAPLGLLRDEGQGSCHLTVGPLNTKY